MPQTKSARTTPSTLGIGLNSFGTTRRRYRVDSPPDRRSGGEMGPLLLPLRRPIDKIKGKVFGQVFRIPRTEFKRKRGNVLPSVGWVRQCFMGSCVEWVGNLFIYRIYWRLLCSRQLLLHYLPLMTFKMVYECVDLLSYSSQRRRFHCVSSSCVASFTEGLMDPTSTTAVLNGGRLRFSG